MDKKNFLILKIFVKFLQVNKVTNKYICNLHNEKNSYKKTYTHNLVFNKRSVEDLGFLSFAHGFFTWAFPWGDTNEGDRFWRSLNNEWEDILCQLEKSHKIN